VSDDNALVDRVLTLLNRETARVGNYARSYRGSSAPQHQRTADFHEELSGHFRRLAVAVADGLLEQLAASEADGHGDVVPASGSCVNPAWGYPAGPAAARSFAALAWDRANANGACVAALQRKVALLEAELAEKEAEAVRSARAVAYDYLGNRELRRAGLPIRDPESFIGFDPDGEQLVGAGHDGPEAGR
jgi:hypothetical protein